MTDLKHIIAIDPGKNGGIAIIRNFGTPTEKTKAIPMPETAHDLYKVIFTHSVNSYCFLEKVGGMPNNGGSRAFNFGKNYGHVEMALAACEIPTETVTPQKWQKEFQLGTKSKINSNTEWKNKLKAKAQQLFPSLKITLALSDALLIGEYGKRQLLVRKR